MSADPNVCLRPAAGFAPHKIVPIDSAPLVTANVAAAPVSAAATPFISALTAEHYIKLAVLAALCLVLVALLAYVVFKIALNTKQQMEVSKYVNDLLIRANISTGDNDDDGGSGNVVIPFIDQQRAMQSDEHAQRMRTFRPAVQSPLMPYTREQWNSALVSAHADALPSAIATTIYGASAPDFNAVPRASSFNDSIEREDLFRTAFRTRFTPTYVGRQFTTIKQTAVAPETPMVPASRQ